MEDLSLAAFWLALAATGAAALFYWAHILGLRLALRRLVTDAGQGPLVASLESSAPSSAWTESLGRLGTLATWTAGALLALSLFSRWRAVGHAPWSNMYEFTLAFAAAITFLYIVFERIYARGEHVRPQEDGRLPGRTLGALLQPVVFGLLVVAALFFPSDIQPLVPALQNQDLLALHVATMLLAYGALSVSFAAAVLYLVQACPERSRRACPERSRRACPERSRRASPEPGRRAGPQPAGRSGKRNRFARLPNVELLDDIAYRSVMVGFPLLAVGIALGAYWGNHAWGRYWGWDPKETSALVTWLIYGAYLHMRGLRGWAGTRSAVVLVAGFAAVIFTYFAVNLWVSGLHSYAGV